MADDLLAAPDVAARRLALTLGTLAGVALVAYLAAVRPILKAADWLDRNSGR